MSAATTAPERADRFGEGGPPRSAAARVGRTLLGTAPIFLVLLALLAWITIENPNFTNPPVFLLFLRGAAPLMILAAGQLFVVLTGEFDLSVGALISLNGVPESSSTKTPLTRLSPHASREASSTRQSSSRLASQPRAKRTVVTLAKWRS